MAEFSMLGSAFTTGHNVASPATVSNNTKGAWSQLTAATPFAASGVFVTVEQQDNSLNRDYLIDIGVGAASSEKVLIPDLLCSFCGQTGTMWNSYPYFFPIQIPKGTRVSARMQASTSGGTPVRVLMWLLHEDFTPSTPLSAVIALGPNTADSGGTSIDPGGSANTKGAWVELSSALPFGIRDLSLAFGNQLNANRGTSGNSWFVDIGVGAGGSEKVLVANWRVLNVVQESFQPSTARFPGVSIPQGTRVSARCECSITDATDRLLDLIAYGAY